MPGQSVIHFLTGAALAPSDRRPSAWERVLASARAVLAVGFAIYCEPTSPSPYAALAYLVVLAYLVYSLLLLVFLRAKQDSSPAFRLSLHAVYPLWAALASWLCVGTTGRLPFEDGL